MINISNERNRFFYMVSAIVLGGILLLQLFIQAGGSSHTESNCFLMLYNFTPDLLKTIFDPLRTDWNLYQGRELSYFIDSIDARFIGWCIKHHMAHFYSLSAVLAAMAILIVQQWGFACGFPKINCWTALGISAIWQLVPCNFFHHFFRCGKPLTALGITVVLFSMRVLWVNERRENRIAAKTLMIIYAFILPLIDRQGIFLLAALTAFSAMAYSVYDDKEKKALFRTVAVCGVGSIAVSTLLNVFIVPKIIYVLNGYIPSFEYQKMPFTAIFDFYGTIYFLIDNIGFWFSGFDNCGVIIVFLLFWVMWLLFRKKDYSALILIAYVFCVLGAMANLMMFRHRLLIMDGVSHSSYFMPFAAVLIFLLAVITESFDWQKVIAGLFFCALISQTVMTVFDKSDPEHNRFHRHSTARILQTLNDEKINPRSVLMPYTSWKMVDAFRGNLRGWEIGGVPIKYPANQ